MSRGKGQREGTVQLVQVSWIVLRGGQARGGGGMGRGKGHREGTVQLVQASWSVLQQGT